MHKKTCTAAAVIAALASIPMLWTTLFQTYVTDIESMNLVVRGYNITEFSPWGALPLLLPLVFVGLLLSKLSDNVKTSGILILFTLNGVALHNGVRAANEWVMTLANGLVNIGPSSICYSLCMIAATLFGLCAYNGGFASKLLTKPSVYLFARRLPFIQYHDDGSHVTQNNTICFATEDGYFSTLPLGKNEVRDIEALEGDGAIGFMLGTMPSGMYGHFYEHYALDFDERAKAHVLPYYRIREKDMTAFVPTAGGGFDKIPVHLSPRSPSLLIAKPLETAGDVTHIGAIVMHRGKTVAIVTDFDEERGEYRCISAEQMETDLLRHVYEHQAFA